MKGTNVMDEAPGEQQEIVNKMRRDGYSETVIDHWLRPRNFGQMTNYDGCSDKYTGPCGDSMWFWIRVNDDIIQKASYVSDICIGSITSGSMLSEMVAGLDIGSVLRLSDNDVLKALGGLPEQYVHCAQLAKDTLGIAIRNYSSYRNAPWKRLYKKG